MNPAARMLTLPGTTLVVTSDQHAHAAATLRAAGAEVLHLPVVSERMNLKQLLEHLAARDVNEVLVEAGATLCGELLRAGLVDELVLYLAPHLLGSDARGLFNITGLADMDQRIALDIQDVRAIGKDWRITAKLQNPS
jgi:diaminohydroxyphosphoribosylaminopyrimidine deaminase/5-amino-6-(5-phosphoribosylamino)uracil reductase